MSRYINSLMIDDNFFLFQNLTTALYKKLGEGEEDVKILGVDIDSLLIDRAKENNTVKDDISFLALDLMSDSEEVMNSLRTFLDGLT